MLCGKMFNTLLMHSNYAYDNIHAFLMHIFAFLIDLGALFTIRVKNVICLLIRGKGRTNNNTQKELNILENTSKKTEQR